MLETIARFVKKRLVMSWSNDREGIGHVNCLNEDKWWPLVEAHGPVRYIVLPSVAPEHKVLAGPFARSFPSAEFYATDKQYSFPLDLPQLWLGFPRSVKPLPPSSRGLGLWGGEFEHEVLTAKASSSSVYQEAAFFHKPSGTLLLCDALVTTPRLSNPRPPRRHVP